MNSYPSTFSFNISLRFDIYSSLSYYLADTQTNLLIYRVNILNIPKSYAKIVTSKRVTKFQRTQQCKIATLMLFATACIQDIVTNELFFVTQKTLSNHQVNTNFDFQTFFSVLDNLFVSIHLLRIVLIYSYYVAVHNNCFFLEFEEESGNSKQ